MCLTIAELNDQVKALEEGEAAVLRMQIVAMKPTTTLDMIILLECALIDAYDPDSMAHTAIMSVLDKLREQAA